MRRVDRERLLQLWNDVAVFDPINELLLEEKVWADDDFVSDLALKATDDDEIVGFVVGVIRPAGVAYIKLLAVDRGWQRSGVGRSLVQMLERFVRIRGAKSMRLFESAPNYLVPGIDRRYEGAQAFASALGYERIGETYNLSVDLGEPFETKPVGAEVRRATAGDHDGLISMLEAHWPAWVPELEAALANEPASVYLAERGSGVVGFAAYDANNPGTGWFGPMGVVESERGSGLGCTLLRNCLNDIRGQGLDAATIPWVGPVQFYERCVGAVVSRTFDRFEKSFASSAG